MIIRVKHNHTEVIVEDDGLRTDTNYNLIYYNQKYLLELLTKIADEIIRIENNYFTE
jgi:hypothetical protein